MIPSEETNFIIEILVKVAGFIAAFVGGIVSATWAISGKIRGFDDRLGAVEQAQKNCQGYTLVRIDQKLDRIHERIDEVLLRQEGKNKG